MTIQSFLPLYRDLFPYGPWTRRPSRTAMARDISPWPASDDSVDHISRYPIASPSRSRLPDRRRKHGQHRADPVELRRNPGLPTDTVQHLRKSRRPAFQFRIHARPLQFSQHRNSCRHRQWIPGKCPGLVHRSIRGDTIHDLRLTAIGPDRPIHRR